MSSYYPSFQYLGINSRDKKLVVTHFDADQDESETFLSMDPIYTEKSDGSRLDYGAKYNNVAVFRITVIKEDGGDFSVKEVREHLRWLTGSKKNSPLDLYVNFAEEFISGDLTNNFTLTNTCDHIARVYVNGVLLSSNEWTYNKSANSIQLNKTPNNGDIIKVAYGSVQYSFICRVTNAWQHKLDARTTGIVLEFTSMSPWAYSAKQVVSTSVDGSITLIINNETDDLYGFTPMNTIFKNATGNTLQISNNTIGEVTEITELDVNETITMGNSFIITSDNSSKVFGNKFNFVFPRLVAGENQITIRGTGNITFEYVYVLKVGDCAIDINISSDPICTDTGEVILVDQLPFNRISELPNNFQAYNIQNVYSKEEVDQLISSIAPSVDLTINEEELNAMLSEELG